MKAIALSYALLLAMGSLSSVAMAQSATESKRKVEWGVLHKQASLQDVRVYSLAKKKWLPLAPSRAKVRVLNLWSKSCAPCLAELPTFAKLVDSYRQKHGDSVQFLFVADPSEHTSAQEVEAFWASPWADALAQKECPGKQMLHNGVQSCLLDAVPSVDPARSESRRLTSLVHPSDESRPVTLLLDEKGVVRQAFVGSFGKNTSDLSDAIDRLLAAVSGRTGDSLR